MRSIAITLAACVLTLSGCDRGGNTTKNSNDIGAPVPAAVRISALPDSTLLRAFLQMDGGALIDMEITNGVAVTSIPALTPRDVSVAILFEYQSPEFGQVMLATAARALTLQTGENTLSFTEQDYQHPDDDQDGETNLSEIINGTDPFNPEDAPEQVVYVNQPISDDAANLLDAEIFKLNAPGGTPVILTAIDNDLSEHSPDVRHDGEQIVFVGDPQGKVLLLDALRIVNIDGSNVVPIADTPGAGKPKWSRPPEPYFIVYVDDIGTASEKLWLTNPDGSGKMQLTFPGQDQSDESVDVIDESHIVFSRLDLANNADRDLFIKDISQDLPVRLTETPNESETLPVVSHDGALLAYRVFISAGQDDQVRVATFDNVGNLSVLHIIDLDPPAGANISGIDFSGDDTQLYISTQANDVPGTLIDRFQEVFRVDLDGSNQVRLTNNSDSDSSPSAVPRPPSAP